MIFIEIVDRSNLWRNWDSFNLQASLIQILQTRQLNMANLVEMMHLLRAAVVSAKQAFYWTNNAVMSPKAIYQNHISQAVTHINMGIG